jgi:type I restriction enzyme S subunit
MKNSQPTIREGYKQTGVGVIPEDWKVKKLFEVANFENGKAHENFIDDIGKYVVVNSKFISSEGEVYKFSRVNLCPLKIGDIAMVMSDIPNGKALAKCYLVKQNEVFVLNQRICSIQATKANNEFLFRILNRNKYFLEFDSGTGQTNLRKDEVLDCPLALPPTIEEQQAIAEVLSDVDALITSLDQLIAKKRNIKQGTMQLLLTGKKRLADCSGDWETKKLGEIAEATAGGTPNTQISSYWNGSIKWMSSGELNLKIVHDVAGRITELGLKNSSAKIIPPNCILVGLAGQGKTRGTIATNKIELCTNQSIAAIYPSKLYVSEFLYHNLDNRYEELRSLSAGDSGRGGLNLTIIKKIEILLPSLAEQKAIARILSDMDAEIEALEKKREKYKAIKQGMMQELLSGKRRLI